MHSTGSFVSKEVFVITKWNHSRIYQTILVILATAIALAVMFCVVWLAFGGTAMADSDDAEQLARIMMAEAGGSWPDAFTMCVGEVVLNRVESPEYPDSIYGVLHQAGQYSPVLDGSWYRFTPGERELELANRLLGGERVFCAPTVVYQALFEQGSRTVMTYCDQDTGTVTYFCRTDNPELYE